MNSGSKQSIYYLECKVCVQALQVSIRETHVGRQVTSLEPNPIDLWWEQQSPSPLSISNVAIRSEPGADCQPRGLREGWPLTDWTGCRLKGPVYSVHSSKWFNSKTAVSYATKSLHQSIWFAHTKSNIYNITAQCVFFPSYPLRYVKTLWSWEGKYHLNHFNSEGARHMEQHKAAFHSVHLTFMCAPLLGVTKQIVSVTVYTHWSRHWSAE